MKLDNRTPFSTLWLPGRMRYPAHSMTVVVKGTFDIVPDDVSTVAESQEPIEPEVPFPGDEDESSLYYDSDLVHFKPRADRLLVGSCHAPRGRATTECNVTFKVGRWSRSMKVIGDRHWDKGFVSTKLSKARPFKSIPLRYENAFGGPGYAANPVGTGYVHKGKFQGSDPVALPNLEDPKKPVKSPTDKIDPVGFGPTSRTWHPRVGLVGTYGDKWFQTRSPWFPKDIDWGMFNSAPEGSQAKGYLKGNEPIVLENLHLDHARLESRLPAIRVRCFAERDPEFQGDPFPEIDMELDTLWIDSDQLKLVLVWRGNLDVASEEFEDLVELHVVQEDLADASKRADEYRRELVSVPSADEAPAEEAEPEEAPAPQKSWTADEVVAAVEAEESLVEADLAGLDLSGADLSGGFFSGANLDDANLSGANLDGADLSRASLRGARLAAASLKQASLWSADLEGALARDANLFEAMLGNASLLGADLRGANLYAADLADTVVDRARLDGANLKRTKLQRGAK